jgi:hypothetical protein
MRTSCICLGSVGLGRMKTLPGCGSQWTQPNLKISRLGGLLEERYLCCKEVYHCRHYLGHCEAHLFNLLSLGNSFSVNPLLRTSISKQPGYVVGEGTSATMTLGERISARTFGINTWSRKEGSASTNARVRAPLIASLTKSVSASKCREI